VGGSATPTEDTSTATATRTELADATTGTPAEPVAQFNTVGWALTRRWLLSLAA
jgi:hypothetical protein